MPNRGATSLAIVRTGPTSPERYWSLPPEAGAHPESATACHASWIYKVGTRLCTREKPGLTPQSYTLSAVREMMLIVPESEYTLSSVLGPSFTAWALASSVGDPDKEP